MLQRVFSLFSTLSIYISESETKGWSLWEFSAKSVCDGRGRSWGKVPMGRPELRLPQQKFCQDWIFRAQSGKIASAWLRQQGPAVAGCFFPYVYLVPWE